jgi:hypothetical protein
MNKLVFLFFMFTFFYGCEDISGRLGVSKTIDDSKERNVFIDEYKPLTNLVIVNDSIKFRVERVWLENCWRFADNASKSNKIEGYQMILQSNKNDLLEFTIKWTIGIDSKKYWRFCSANNIITDFSEIPNDTIIWKVQWGSHLDSLSEKNVVGEFKLVKK